MPLKQIENRPPASLRQRLVKTRGRPIQHARHYWLMLAESHLTRRLFGSTVRRIEAPAVATGKRVGDDTAKPGRPGRERPRRVCEMH